MLKSLKVFSNLKVHLFHIDVQLDSNKNILIL